MTTRTQIYLPTDEHRRARLRAAEQGISLTEYIRRLVHRDLASAEEGASGSIEDIFALGDSGGSDIARFKDEYLADAIDAHRLERQAR